MSIWSITASAKGRPVGLAYRPPRARATSDGTWPAGCTRISWPTISLSPTIDPAPAPRAEGARSAPQRALSLLGSLAESDMRARYGRGPWQLFKWLVDPFALTGVYLAFVVFVLDRPGGAPGLSLACAVVPFQLVIATVITSLDSTRARETIIANMAFPRTYIPAAAAFTESVAFAASSVLLALMMAVYAVAPTTAILWLPVILLTSVAFAVALSYPAALFALWLPDLRMFAISLVRTAFFLAAGIIPLSQIGGTTNDLVRLNPLTGLFESYRSVLLEGSAPEAWMLLWPLGFALALAVVFIPIYHREQVHLAKVIG